MTNNSQQDSTRNRLTAEQRKARNKRIKRKRMFRMTVVAVAVVMLLAAVASPFVLFTAFKVSAFEIKGAKIYNDEMIASATGINVGDNLLLCDIEAAAQNICSALPYVESALITRSLPDKINITVKQANEAFALATAEGFCVLSDKLKVLKTGEAEPGTLPVINSATPETVKEGQKIVFARNDKKEDILAEYLSALAAGIKKNAFEDVTLVDLSDSADIFLVCEGRIVLEMGSVYNIDDDLSTAERITRRLSLAKKVIEREGIGMSTEYVIINLRTYDAAYVTSGIDEESKYAFLLTN